MSLPLRPLPVLEKYDCHGCGDCCFGTIIHLSDDDLARIRDQHWEKRPELRGKKIFVREALFGGRYQLAKRDDGGCIFLMPDRRCRIHAEFGFEAKPVICQIAPLQTVPLDQFAYLTIRRYCRSAVRDDGRPLEEHIGEVRKLMERYNAGPRAAPPPPVTRRGRLEWKDTLAVSDALSRLMLDQRYPPVRRLVHGLEFCSLLDRCQFKGLERRRLMELLGMLEQGAVRESSAYFKSRVPPTSQASKLFRQTVLEYLRLHPQFVPQRTWGERMRLVTAAVGFARGRGPVPLLRLPFPSSTFQSLEEPLGHLDAAVLQPITAYFETITASFRFAVLGRPGWTVTQSLQAMALSYSVAMWMLRLACGGQAPTVEQSREVAMLLDRAQGYAPLVTARHRFRVSWLARQGQLARLAVWYAR